MKVLFMKNIFHHSYRSIVIVPQNPRQQHDVCPCVVAPYSTCLAEASTRPLSGWFRKYIVSAQSSFTRATGRLELPTRIYSNKANRTSLSFTKIKILKYWMVQRILVLNWCIETENYKHLHSLVCVTFGIDTLFENVCVLIYLVISLRRGTFLSWCS